MSCEKMGQLTESIEQNLKEYSSYGGWSGHLYIFSRIEWPTVPLLVGGLGETNTTRKSGK